VGLDAYAGNMLGYGALDLADTYQHYSTRL